MKIFAIALLLFAQNIFAQSQVSERTLYDSRCEDVVKYTRAIALLYVAGIPLDQLPRQDKNLDLPTKALQTYILKFDRSKALKSVELVRLNCEALDFENLTSALLHK